jgi:Cu2+-exporting ATPase
MAQYVLSLSNNGTDAAAAARGAPPFQTFCVACHGADGTGNPLLGAPNVTAIEVHPGAGVAGRWGGATLRLGSAAFCGVESPLRSIGAFSTIYLSRDTQLIATFGVSSTLRADADDTIRALQRLGLRIEMLSGDGFSPTAAASAALSGIPFRATVTPEQKLEYVQALQHAGRRVVMVGDGINDVPVLAAAAVSVTPLEATDLAKNASNAILLSRGLAPPAAAIEVARRTRTVSRQNLAWALVYNVIAIPLAMCGAIEPWVAALGMSASSLLVTVNALRLSRPVGTRATVPGAPHSHRVPEPLPA